MKAGRFLVPGWCGLLLLVSCALSVHAAPATQASITEIQAALDNGDAVHAKAAADAALAAGDVTALQRARLLLNRGMAQHLLGASQDAMVDFTDALQTGGLPPEERAQALLQRGYLLDSMNRLNDAAKDYGAVIAMKSAVLPTALNNRANIYRRQNRLDEARRDYLAALAAGSARPQYPYYGLGQIAEARQDREAARGYYARAVAADPRYGLAADRLAALGGPLDGARTDTGVVLLKPPRAAEPERVVLRPPPGVAAATDNFAAAPAADSPILLRSPARRPAPVRMARRAAGGPALKPALDAAAWPGGPAVQLGAWRSRAEAEQGRDKALRQADGLLDGLTPQIVEADLPGKGHYFRLRTGLPPGMTPAAFCAALSDHGMACFPVRD